MKKRLSLIIILSILLGVMPVYTETESGEVDVNLSSGDITINGTKVDNSKEAYPFVSYKDITYFPMTWDFAVSMGLSTFWTPETGLKIYRTGNGEVVKLTPTSENDLTKLYKATISSSKIEVEGSSINNDSEEFPILIFRDITYFPMTWRFMVEEFGADYSWHSKTGLNISSIDKTPMITIDLISAYNQAYQENYEADDIEYILETASNSYVLLDPFSEDDISNYIDEIKANNNEVSAYISIGTGEKWRDDYEVIKPFLVRKQWGEWAGEYFVDNTLNGILVAMKKRIDEIARIGYDWVEFDNMDWAFDDENRNEYGFEVTEKESIEYYNLLCEYAHQKGLKCMAKNLTSNIEGFDGVTFESYSDEKNWWDEDELKDFIAKEKIVLINHYNEINSDEVYAYYINIYGSEILFISEDKTTKKYRHY
jgi:hypothetical protein